MLKRNELKTISDASILIQYLKQYAQSDDSFYEDTGVSIHYIENTIEELQSIYIKYAEEKIKASERANAYNKAHPEKHRQLNKEYAKRKREEVK